MQNAGFSEKLDAKQIDHKSGPEESDAAVNRPEDGAEHKKNGYKCDKKTCSDQPPGDPEDFQRSFGNSFIKFLEISLGKEKPYRKEK
ncbi:MAG: hypothetical protein E7055_18040 [Lentisphaerae bacterium]|nr:hypothetical protein [Lentisphaerota bacterium]